MGGRGGRGKAISQNGHIMPAGPRSRALSVFVRGDSTGKKGLGSGGVCDAADAMGSPAAPLHAAGASTSTRLVQGSTGSWPGVVAAGAPAECSGGGGLGVRGELPGLMRVAYARGSVGLDNGRGAARLPRRKGGMTYACNRHRTYVGGTPRRLVHALRGFWGATCGFHGAM